MRLLIATPEYPPHAGGGLLRFYATLAPALVRAGVDVTVVVAAPFDDEFSSYEHEGVRVKCVPRDMIEKRSRDMPQFSAAPMFRRWLAGARAARDFASSASVDCVEATDFGLSFVPFVLSPSPPVVVQLHGSLGQISEHEPRRADRQLDFSLARLAEASLLGAADQLQSYGSPNVAEWGARLGRAVELIPPPLAVSDGVAPLGDEVVVIGRIQPWKGPEVLCQALRRVPPVDMPRVSWIGRDTASAPGGGSFDQYLREHYPDVWGPRVEIMGQLPYAALSERLNKARIVIVPSQWDVFNFTAAEGMAAGRVVICSDGAGAADLLESGVNGFTFRAGDNDALAEVLVTAAHLKDPAATEMGRHARSTVETRLNPDAISVQRMAMFEAAKCAPFARHSIDWVGEFFSGSDDSEVDAAFLDQMSLATLSRYVARRAKGRMLERVTDVLTGERS